jgi:hypothetical protein
MKICISEIRPQPNKGNEPSFKAFLRLDAQQAYSETFPPARLFKAETADATAAWPDAKRKMRGREALKPWQERETHNPQDVERIHGRT